ncbi:GNAT family N-acetyltransferase [Natronocalculus amylovorans]|uniref:GNAT family N-acetyltransferase n=1 Tax=Natronocalculus amylovorans TaxID=2917812 RepID=A0AAE3FWG7_9EURY|nr:N-acetyltransferase [Natronocalculus amylovorans]MCL9816258.1 GNAT family N-acetyltransferase [Natronocalculus amylovorans]NUE03348.1 GNAT family N-acetyltransferase [Halorubraceae archaeon YAN]
MSINVETRIDPPGEAKYVAEAWALKEDIRQTEGVLRQQRGFFTDAYRRSTAHLIFENTTLVAFASVRRDGYILFLAVSPSTRGRGYGEQLIAAIADEYRSVTCHARSTNENALGFYEHLGFKIRRRIDNYYEDGGNAYYLKLGNDDSIRQKLSELIRR